MADATLHAVPCPSRSGAARAGRHGCGWPEAANPEPASGLRSRTVFATVLATVWVVWVVSEVGEDRNLRWQKRIGRPGSSE